MKNTMAMIMEAVGGIKASTVSLVSVLGFSFN